MARQATRKKYKKIFISWSGDTSKEIAKNVKRILEEEIFKGTDLNCFFSDVDINSGDDWWEKIKTELKECSLGIVCITKENMKAPWIYFESGAIVAHNLKLIPFLVECNVSALNNTPISNKNMTVFRNKEKFFIMVKTINDSLNLLQVSNDQLKTISNDGYRKLNEKLKPTLKTLNSMRVFNESYIYPPKIKTVNLNTVYICAPMSSITSTEYYDLRNFLLNLKSILENLGFEKVICPAFENSDYNNFDGNTKAIIENFTKLRQVDSMIVLYPKLNPSSILVEMGYGLALSKKTVMFYKEGLPYILKESGQSIPHIHTEKYSNWNDIIHIIESNGRQLFGFDEED